jgi:hypothetical protein
MHVAALEKVPSPSPPISASTPMYHTRTQTHIHAHKRTYTHANTHTQTYITRAANVASHSRRAGGSKE